MMRQSEPVRSKCILQHYSAAEKNPTYFTGITMNTNKIPISSRFLRSGNVRSLKLLQMAFLKFPSALRFSCLIPNWTPGFQEIDAYHFKMEPSTISHCVQKSLLVSENSLYL